MIFTYKKWDKFCCALSQSGIKSVPAFSVNSRSTNYVVLKHDVETDVRKAFIMAEIEQKYAHCGSYYVQAYLLDNSENIKMLTQMQQMGHEISYHYDVMDSNKGDIEKAIIEFENNKQLFENNGFILSTVCQHGNPIVERVGYTSNRDFFRTENVQKKYPEISDIMVNYKEKHNTDYLYFSDAGRKFRLIFDPINNDVINSDDKNVEFEDLTKITEYIKKGCCIISTHPHRWCSSAVIYVIKNAIFKAVKTTAKILIKIPVLKRIINRYYYLAKKI